LQANGISQAFSRGVEMNILTWRQVLTTLNPSPIFVALGDFAEVLAVNGDALLKNSNDQEVKGCHTSQH